MAKNAVIITEDLKHVRALLNWTQKDLSEYSRVSLTTIWRAEKGVPISVFNATKIKHVLRIGY